MSETDIYLEDPTVDDLEGTELIVEYYNDTDEEAAGKDTFQVADKTVYSYDGKNWNECFSGFGKYDDVYFLFEDFLLHYVKTLINKGMKRSEAWGKAYTASVYKNGVKIYDQDALFVDCS